MARSSKGFQTRQLSIRLKRFQQRHALTHFNCPLCGKQLVVQLYKDRQLGKVKCRQCGTYDEIPYAAIYEPLKKDYRAFQCESVDVYNAFIDRLQQATQS